MSKRNQSLAAILCVILALFASPTLQGLTPKGKVPNSQMLPSDTLSFELEEYFNLDDYKFPLTGVVNKGTAVTFPNFFKSKTFPESKYGDYNFVERVTDDLMVLVANNNKVVFQNVSADGQSLYAEYFYDFGSVGSNLFCSGFCFNEVRGYLYVGCYNQKSINAIHIFTYDLATQKVVATEISDDHDDFKVRNRLQLVLNQGDEKGEGWYLVAFDQGQSHQERDIATAQVRVFRNIVDRDLTYYFTSDVWFDEEDNIKLYNLYSYQSGLIYVGRFEDRKEFIGIASCKIDLDMHRILCDDHIKYAKANYGFVGIEGEKYYYEINSQTKTLIVNYLTATFRDSYWNTERAMEAENLDLADSEHTYIRGADINEYGVVIHYGDSQMDDPYSVILSFTLGGVSKLHPNVTGALFDKTFMIGMQNDPQDDISISMIRNSVGFYLLNGQDLDDGLNAISLKITDAAGSQAEQDFVITGIKSIFEQLSIKETPASMKVTSGSSSNYPFKLENLVAGNSITALGTSSNDSLVTVETTPIEELTFKFDQTFTPLYYHMDGSMVVTEELNGEKVIILRIHTCTSKATTVTCTQIANKTLESGERFERKLFYRSTYGFFNVASGRKNRAFAVDSTGKLVEYTSTNDDTFLANVVCSQTDKNCYAIHIEGYEILKIWQFDVQDITKYKYHESLDKDDIEEGWFCPRDIQLVNSASFGDDMFHVLSTCPRSAPKIFTVSLTNLTKTFEQPLDDGFTAINFCSFDNEYIVRHLGNVFGISPMGDFNRWVVPTIDLLETQTYIVDCIQSSQKGILTGSYAGSNKKVIIPIIGNRGPQQSSRFPIAYTAQAKAVTNFDFLGDSLHLIDGLDGKFSFIRVLEVPRIVVKAAAGVTTQSTAKVTIELDNKEGSAKFNFYVIVNPKPNEKNRMFFKFW